MSGAWQEDVLEIDCEGSCLTGIVTRPQRPARTGVLIIVGGPQYRVGSHRQFVLLARRLAAQGYLALRFDVRGMGDSVGELRDFQQIQADVAAALASLTRVAPELQQLVLWGLCDGASAALMQCLAQPHPMVRGLCLVNPWVRSAEGLARTQLKHYYLQRLAQREFWIKLLSGRVAGSALSGLWNSLRLATARRSAPASGPGSAAASLPFQSQMQRGLATFEGAVLVLLSGRDYTAREFSDTARNDPAWRRALQRPGVTQADLPDADHTCSAPASQDQLETLTADWLQQHWPVAGTGGAA